MKIKTGLIVIFFIAALLTPAGFPARAASDSIRWHAYDQGMALAKQENKKIFLHFWAEWCTYCRKMEKETFRDSAVIAYLNKHFISIRVNTDKEQKLAGRFGIRGVPDNWFVDETGQEISNRSGFVPVKLFLPILKYIHTDSYKNKSFGDFLRDM